MLNTKAWASALYDQPQLKKSWKHLQNTFKIIGFITWCIPLYDGHMRLRFVPLRSVRRELSRSHQLGSRTIVISVKRAFKCYLCTWPKFHDPWSLCFVDMEYCLDSRSVISIESSLQLNTMTYASVLYNQRQLHKSWKHLENTFQIGRILCCTPLYEGHNNLGLIRL